MDERNRLSKEVRAQIVSLSLWVTRYSKDVVREGASMDPLIEVNRTIMQGLQGAA
jgi:flagellar protein FlaF